VGFLLFEIAFMIVFLMITNCVGGNFSRTRASLTVTDFLSGAFTFWAGQAAFAGASLTFEKLDDVKNIHFFDHPGSSTPAAPYDSF
jgi:hypothetical protein